MTTELAKTRMDEKGLVLNDASELSEMCRLVVGSELCPQQYRNKPRDAMIAILTGKAVGFAPIQSLQVITVINGRPSMYGDGPTSLAYASGKVEWIREWFELAGATVVPNYYSLDKYPDGLTACWQTKRKDNTEPSSIVRFSVSDAKAAGLWNKKGPWQNYTKRMLMLRARSWGLRDNYADALQGISQAEEWEDMLPQHQKHDLASEIGRPTIEHDIVETSQADSPPSGELVDAAKPEPVETTPAPAAPVTPKPSEPVEILGMSKPFAKLLHERAGIQTIGELVRKSENELLCLPGFTPVNVGKLREALQKAGLDLGMDG